MYLVLFLFLPLYLRCEAVLPPYLPILENNNFERVDLIERYFHMGLGYSEIVLFLGLLHGYVLSIRQLKRILQQRGLGRRRNRSNIEEVYRAIRRELRGSGSMMGYRQMTRRLLHGHSVVVDKETVRELLKILDPEGVVSRLGPLLFSIYVNDLPSAAKNCSSESYVDDTKLLLSFRINDSDTALTDLNEDLIRIRNWCFENLILLNPDKTN
jgi:hypothetical protein